MSCHRIASKCIYLQFEEFEGSEVMIFYFSGTGNSRYVAHTLAQFTHDQADDLAEASRTGNFSYSIQKDEPVGFVFPVYSWGPPQVVLEFVRKLYLECRPAYVYAVCTCGDDAGRTMQLFNRRLKEKGWKTDATFSVIMPNTYVCLPGFDVDAPAVQKRKLEAAPARLEHIASVVQQRARGVDEVHQGGVPRLKSYVVRPLFNRVLLTDKPFHTTDDCTGCGLCVSRCPVGNMEMHDKKPHWKGHCTGCLCCYHTCSHRAIRFGSTTEHKGQYLCKVTFSV